MGVTETLKRMRIRILSALQRIKPIRKNKILFWSDLGQRYSCNPRYLSEYISITYPNVYDVVWMFQSTATLPSDLPKNVRVVRYFSKEWLYEIATAKYVVCNHRIPSYFYFKKRKKQVYIQTWHSSLRLKAIEGDAAEELGAGYIEGAKKDSKQIDYLLSGCGFSSEIFRKSFWYDGEILEAGTPRIDYLLSQVDDKDSLFDKVKLSKKYKYVLYAPTFRNGDDLSAYDIDAERLVANLQVKFGGEWKVLYRLHPNLAQKIQLDNLPACCIDMTSYQDMQELLVLSDILITDYSSCMFDVAYLNKLCVLYVSDLERYIQNERRLYFEIPSLPFLIAKSNDELEEKIGAFEEKEYQTNLQAFLQTINSFERGNACKTIVKRILRKEENI